MRKKGLTLFEIMIVLAIIGILIAISVPSLLRARQISRLNYMGIEDVDLRTALTEKNMVDDLYGQYVEHGKLSQEEIYIAAGFNPPVPKKLFPEDPEVVYEYYFEIVIENGTLYSSNKEPEILNGDWVKFFDSTTREFRTIKNVQEIVRKRKIKD